MDDLYHFTGGAPMVSHEQVMALLKEGEVYQSQGLFEQAREKYLDIRKMMKRHDALSSNKKLVAQVDAKTEALENILKDIDQDNQMPGLSEDVQDLISDLFSSSSNKDIAAVDGAVALVKFGQYERALAEFQKLLNRGILPMMVAKNMLRCHLFLASPEKAVHQFNRWFTINLFSSEEIKHLGGFLKDLLIREKAEAHILQMMHLSQKNDAPMRSLEDIFEISSVRIKFGKGLLKNKKIDLNVAYQSGNNLSFIIKASNKKLARAFKPGIRMPRIQCYSPISVFNTRGFITDKKMIGYGPKCGDYLLDMMIDKSESPH
jgi:tetratricopeptide (TPR) repeat protein